MTQAAGSPGPRPWQHPQQPAARGPGVEYYLNLGSSGRPPAPLAPAELREGPAGRPLCDLAAHRRPGGHQAASQWPRPGRALQADAPAVPGWPGPGRRRAGHGQGIIKFSLPNEITPFPTNMHSLPTFSIFAQTPTFFAQTPLIFAQPSTFARPPATGQAMSVEIK